MLESLRFAPGVVLVDNPLARLKGWRLRAWLHAPRARMLPVNTRSQPFHQPLALKLSFLVALQIGLSTIEVRAWLVDSGLGWFKLERLGRPQVQFKWKYFGQEKHFFQHAKRLHHGQQIMEL